MQNISNQASQAHAESRTIRAAIVGTGYIADFHARAIRTMPGVELVSVCDTNFSSAKLFAATWGINAAYSSLESMLRDVAVDSLHVLAPPDRHFSLAKTALAAGLHVLIEKPMSISVAEADGLLAESGRKKQRLGVNHNLLYASPYQRLRDAVRAGTLGPLSQIGINYLLELPPIRFGPYESWMLLKPGNVILEIGPHPLSMLLDLVGAPDQLSVKADRYFRLPGGKNVVRRWRIQGNVGETAIEVNIDLSPGFPQRTINARGLIGSATVDFDANICTVDRSTPSNPDIDQYKRSRLITRQILSQARTTLSDYLLTRLKLRRRGNPYETSIIDSVASFYDGLHLRRELDYRIDGRLGRDVVDLCNKIISKVHFDTTSHLPSRRPRPIVIRPAVLVVGGTGFIGRELIRQLLTQNYDVRAAVRGSSAVLDDLDNDHLEVIRGDIRNEADLKLMLNGIDYVFHLARANAKSWLEYIQRDVEPTRLLGEACLAAGIKRLIYTGTIDSYYAGANAGVITEETPLDRKIERRNYYARAKAAAENILMDMQRNKGLPLVILRPGIVIGHGGNPFHWGVGRWVANSICDVWGRGNNNLPFVLVQDVATALVRSIQVPGIEGRSYNLIDTPLLTANDYLKELQHQSGLRLTIRHPAIWQMYIGDLTKWFVKMAVGHPDRARIPYYYDWETRTQRGQFDCTRARIELGWQPASDRKRMIEDGIGRSLEAWLAATK